MNDTPSRPSLAVLANQLLDAARGGVSVACTAEVVAFDRTKSEARVRPLVSARRTSDEGDEFVDAPTIDGVPVLFPAGGGFALTFDLAAGDLGTLLIRDRSHDEVDAGDTSYPVQPASRRRFDYSDAVFMPGFVAPGDGRPSNEAAASSLTMRLPNGAELRIGSATANKALAVAEKVSARLDTLQQAHDTHKHTGVTTGPGTSAVPDVIVGPLASVASSRAFTDDT